MCNKENHTLQEVKNRQILAGHSDRLYWLIKPVAMRMKGSKSIILSTVKQDKRMLMANKFKKYR